MATAYTSLLGLALPVTGELSGTWGDTVNNSITSLLDSAIAGTTTLSSDADVTLTTTTGASNTSRQAILLWTAGGTVTRNITAPAQSKIYTVINKSSSTQSIVLRGVGPTTGVTIVQGESAVCAWNGSDFIKISNTSGAGVFTTLSVTGVATFSAGTASLPAITTTGDTNTGIWFPAADTIAFTEGGVESMRIDASGNLGLGVTPSAWSTGKAIQVGTLQAAIWGTGDQIDISGNAYYNSGWKAAATKAGASLYEQALGVHSWSVSGAVTAGNAITFTQAMTLDASGNLGIGTTSPSSILHISKGATSGAQLNITRSTATATVGVDNGNSIIVGAAAGDLSIRSSNANILFADSSGTEGMRLASGNLGLGVTPTATWNSAFKVTEIKGAGNAFFAGGSGWTLMSSNAFYGASGWQYGASGNLATAYEQYNGTHVFKIAPNNGGAAGATCSFTQAMTLDSSGNLLVGTTSSLGGLGARVNIDSDTSRGIVQNITSSSPGRYQEYLFTGSTVGSISTNGTTTTYNTTSDYRLKNNQEPLTGSGAFIDALQPKTWNWSQNGSKGAGFIAHEFAEVSPSSVNGEKDALDADGNPVYQSMQASSAEVIANLVAEIQSLRQRLSAANL